MRERERRERRVPRSSVAASVGLHLAGALVLILGSATLRPPAPLRTYQVKLVAAAAQRAPEREVPSPPEQTEERRERKPEPEPEDEREPEPEPEPAEQEAPPAPPQQEPAKSQETEGTESVNVELEGAVFPYPGYLENIIRQVNRYWRPPEDKRALRAELSFVIHRDGTVSDIRWIHRSGDPVFDLEARGAIEAAGRNKAFGPLPQKYPRDRLRVSFFFDPTSR